MSDKDTTEVADCTWEVICDRLAVKRGSDAFTVISAIEKLKVAASRPVASIRGTE